MAHEYQRREAGSPQTFTAMLRLIAGLTGLSLGQSFPMASRIFSKELAAFLFVLELGNIAAPAGRYAGRFNLRFL